MVQHALFERDIMTIGACPFIVRMFYSFATKNHVFYAMEFLPGGDLYSLLQAVGCLDEAAAKVYVAGESERVPARVPEPESVFSL